MKTGAVLLFVLALFLPDRLIAQGERYRHPVFDFSFEASPNWTGMIQDSGNMDYALINPNHNMVITLRYVPDCKSVERYMKRLSGLKGLICYRGGYDTILNDQKVVVMQGNCLENRESYSTMVVGFPKEKGLYLMEITCPDNCTPEHQKRVKAILHTVRVGGESSG